MLQGEGSGFHGFVQFTKEEGLVVDKTNYPFIEMDWAEGNTLLEEVEKLHNNRNRKGLEELAQRWKDLVELLDKIEMAHGDLAGDNVTVVGNRLVLIDYDGVFFNEPVLRNNPPDERGNPKYQHRESQQCRAYNERMDDFSSLAIYVAILAIAEDLTLFKKYADPTEGKLLYEAYDLADPDQSRLFADSLRRLQTPAVRELVKRLEDACRGPIHKVPRFRPPDPFAELRELSKEPPPLDWTAIERVEAAGNLAARSEFPKKELQAAVDAVADTFKP